MPIGWPLITYNGKVAKREKPIRKRPQLIDHPEELVYRSCYAPADLRKMLANAQSRSKIRRLPASHLFFGLKELELDEIPPLLSHVTQEQWTGVLDLDLWFKDRMNVDRFIDWQKHILEAVDPVARKLIRAADPEMWELTFKRRLEVHVGIHDALEGESEEVRTWFETPDGNHSVALPPNPDEARLFRLLLLRLYGLEPGWTSLMLDSSRYRTSAEIEEAAYRNRTLRMENLGFQDYFDAIEIYTSASLHQSLPEKKWEGPIEMSVLPAKLPRLKDRPLLIFRAFAHVSRPQEIQTLVEELFFVCNKVLSADRISPAEPRRIKRGIRKTIDGINLGLDCWSAGNLTRAIEGIRRHYLQSFFKIGYGQLHELRTQAKKIAESSHSPEPGSFLEVAQQSLSQKYPLLAESPKGKIRKRFFQTRQDLKMARKYLKEISSEGSALSLVDGHS